MKYKAKEKEEDGILAGLGWRHCSSRLCNGVC